MKLDINSQLVIFLFPRTSSSSVKGETASMLSVLLICMGIAFETANSFVTGNTQDFAVRLNNSFGNSSKEGRLEIYYSGKWGTVCDDGFTNESAGVACASLGFAYIGAVIRNRHGAGSGPIWLDNVNCTGTESGVKQCDHNGWGVHNCNHGEDVSISCECGERYFPGPTGGIISPNFPLLYANSLDCYSYIRVTSGHTVIITFLAFNTEACCDWVTITCTSGNGFRSPRYMGFELPPVLTISSCNLVNVSFHTDGSTTSTGFRLTYNITSDNLIGGLTTKPSNAFPRSDKDDSIIFNCTTASKYLPWWAVNAKGSSRTSKYGPWCRIEDTSARNYTITNSTCGVITSASYRPSSWFITETLGPGSCNLIVIAPANDINLLSGSLVCTDSTLSSARAILAPINLQLRSTKGINSLAAVTGKIRDEEMKISCNPFFTDGYSFDPRPSLVFTYFPYSGGPVVRVHILRTYWTSEGNIISSNNTSNASSFVLVKVPKDGIIPRYTCNVVCDFFSNNISDIMEISFSTEPEVLYKTYQNLKLQVSILEALLGIAVLTIIIILAMLIGLKCRQLKRNTATDVGHEFDGNEHELRQRGGESNRYEVGFGNAADVDESEYENVDALQRHPAQPAIYQELKIKK